MADIKMTDGSINTFPVKRLQTYLLKEKKDRNLKKNNCIT